jgi:TonB family protein
MGLFCALTILVFSQTEQNLAIRDTVIQNILSGNDSAAIRISEEVLLFSKGFVDPILLGFLYYAYENILSLSIPPSISYLGKKKEFNLMDEWNQLSEKHPANITVLKIYCFLCVGTNDYKAVELVEKIKATDSLNAYPDFIPGFIFEYKDSLINALPFFQHAFLKDSLFLPTIEKLTKIYYLTGQYDNAIHYGKKFLEITDQKKTAFTRYQKIYDRQLDEMTVTLLICCLKNRDTGQVEELLTSYSPPSDSSLLTYGLIDIRTFIKVQKNNSLSLADTFYIPVAGFGTAAILTADSISIVFAKDYSTKPEPITTVEMKYPKEAIKKRYEGEVVVAVIVDERGKVIKARIEISSGYSILDKTALKEVKKFRFKPATFFGKPVKVGVYIPCHFKLKPRSDWLKK